MKITLDEDGILLPDTIVQDFVKEAVANRTDVHTAQELVLLGLRAELLDIPIAMRPKVEWTIYGKQVHFDKDLRSFDAWLDPRTCVSEGFLNRLILGLK
jgi:hypothetical protein